MVLYIGLSGKMLAGKGKIREILEKNYKSFSIGLSDMLREEADRRGIEKNRENLVNLADELRLKNGPGILAELAIKKIMLLGEKLNDYELVIIDSIRNPYEVVALRNTFKKYFYLIFVDAPLELRFKRAMERKREGESSLTFEEFKEKDEIEFKGREDRKIEDEESEHGGFIDYGVNLSACLKKSNLLLINDKSESELESNLINLIEKRKKEISEKINDDYKL